MCMAINSQVVIGTIMIDQLIPVVRDMLHRVVRQDMTGLMRFLQSPQGPWFDIVYREGVEIDLAQLRQFPFKQIAPVEIIASGNGRKTFLKRLGVSDGFPIFRVNTAA